MPCRLLKLDKFLAHPRISKATMQEASTNKGHTLTKPLLKEARNGFQHFPALKLWWVSTKNHFSCYVNYNNDIKQISNWRREGKTRRLSFWLNWTLSKQLQISRASLFTCVKHCPVFFPAVVCLVSKKLRMQKLDFDERNLLFRETMKSAKLNRLLF